MRLQSGPRRLRLGVDCSCGSEPASRVPDRALHVTWQGKCRPRGHMALAASLRRLFLLATAAGLVLVTRLAHAAGERRTLEQAIHGPSADQCPLPSAVASETWKLTPADRRDVFENLSDVLIEDLGASYRVVITTPEGTTTRTYPGPDRECARRARFAAVFIVLTLMPPEVPVPDSLPEL